MIRPGGNRGHVRARAAASWGWGWIPDQYGRETLGE
jgi:hypothetical protein